jgi:hypothetical protein
MSDTRHTEKKPWEPELEKQPGFNPFANDQNPANNPELDLEEAEDDSEEFRDKIKP